MRSSTITIVFTDLVGSMQLKSTLGDKQAVERIQRHHVLVRKLAAETGGHVLKSLGDGFLVTFDAPTDSLRFSLFLQFAHATTSKDLPGVRIGMHLGEVSEDDSQNDIYGLAVDLASRVQSLSEPGQVLMTSTVYEALRPRIGSLDLPLPASTIEHGRFRFAGLDYPVSVIEVGFEKYSPLRCPGNKAKAWRLVDDEQAYSIPIEEHAVPGARIVFRNLGKGSQPAANEVFILALAGERVGSIGLASLVNGQDLNALARGKGPIDRIVVPVDETSPALDHMLAASMVQRLVSGKKLGSHLDALCSYVALVREGFRPAAHPVEHSIEAIYLAMLLSGEQNLALPRVGAEFLNKWGRLESALFAAAEQKLDPFTTAFLATEPAFARERAFLLRDQEVYRSDVRDGDRFLVSIPDGPEHASALLLYEPRSILWKFWSRADRESPTGDAYHVLGVNAGSGRWVFSTDPVRKTSLKGLWNGLQSAESRTDAALSRRDPWSDGAMFGHTLIKTPRAGTRMTKDEVVRSFTKWCSAKRVA